MNASLTWRQVLSAMRLQHGPLSDAQIYVVGCFDQKVTLHSQQLRAFNLAWALQESQIVNKDTRVAVIGGGAAGLSVVAGLYKCHCNPVLFEQKPTWMHLQAGNTTRYLHPNIYEWPIEDLANLTDDLPDLKWRPNPSSEVAREITSSFRRYIGHFVDYRGKTVLSISGSASGIAIRFMDDASHTEMNEHFDVVVIAVGFGLERMIEGFPQLSYWSNDDIAGVIGRPTKAPSLIIGCGDGGLTDAIRLCFHGFQHGSLEDLARLPALLSLGSELIRTEAANVSPADHDALYRTVRCSGEVIKYIRDKFDLRRGFVELTDRSGFLYRSQASRLNKLLVRHLVELDAIRWVPHDRIFSNRRLPLADWILKRNVNRSKAQVLVRVGAEHVVQRLLPGAPSRRPSVEGYRLGSEAFFPADFFRGFPRDTVAPKKLLILTAVSGGVAGGGTSGELREVKRLLTSTMRVPPEIWELGYPPRFTKYASILRDLYETVERWKPDVIVVLGSDFFPILDQAHWILRPFLPFRKSGQSIRGITRDIPIVYFGAVVPDNPSANLFCVKQEVDSEDIVRAIEDGFGGKTINFVIMPFYAIDWFFWWDLGQVHKRLWKLGEVTFKFRTLLVWSEGSKVVRKLNRRYKKRQRVRVAEDVYAGRMAVHMLATQGLMRAVPCISSYKIDLDSGSMISFDNDNQACGGVLAKDFIVPLLEGRKPARAKSVLISVRYVDGRRSNAEFHNFTIGQKLLDRIRDW